MDTYKIWECLVCSWVYDESKGWPDDGIAPGTRWEDIPNDWLCPECGVGKEDFEMIAVGTAKTSTETTAPTATAAAATPVTSASSDPYKIWECLVCGWIYDEAKGCPDEGIAPGTRWDDIPSDWLCPECGVGKEDFDMIAIGASPEAPAAAVATKQAHEALSTINNSIDPVVIIGSGLAGYNVVKEFRKLDQSTPVVVITSDDGRFYSKPLISTGFHKRKSADDMAQATAMQMADEWRVKVRIFSTVTGIDTNAQTIQLGASSIKYGKLVFATGASCIEAPLEGNALAEVYSVNDLLDYTRFCTSMAGVKRVLIIGAGLIGSEYANDLIQAGYDVDVVDPMPTVLASLLPASASQSVRNAMEQAGVNFHFETVVKTVDNAVEGGVVATLSNGETINADIVLSAIGVRPRVDLAKDAGLNTNRGIAVDRNLQASATNVYALGDCAEVDSHVLFYISPLMACARALAKTLTGDATAVNYGTMPVMVKTTLFPVVTNPPARDTEGEWIIEQDNAQGVKAVFKDTNGNTAGFALTGECVKQKESLAQVTLPVMRD
jgi:rubredoxin-NAD+ reductase